MAAQGESSQAPPARLQEIISDSERFQELSDSDIDQLEDQFEDLGNVTDPYEAANMAWVNSMISPIRETLETKTSDDQEETLSVVLPFLEGNPNGFTLNEFGIPKLQRDLHILYMIDELVPINAAYMTVMDASRPWILYWTLQGLVTMGADVTEYSERVTETFAPCQHPTGGIGGGDGHLPHFAATYAAILSIAIVGTPAAYSSIDRKSMWHFVGRMKQSDGGFTMAPGGEEDVRGAFCALVILSLLNLPLELPPDAPARTAGFTTFLDGLGEWIGRCQSYEGGIAAAPGLEAHGAYAFCGLGCLAIMGDPKDTFNKYLHMPSLISWLVDRQCAPEGGYCGRTNKLVDGCYSHWAGSCFPLLEAALPPNSQLFNRAALARYILSAAQFKKGGLIDKPGKRPDAYHSCYNLAGLSAAQHKAVYDPELAKEFPTFGAPFGWKDGGLWDKEERVWGEEDVLGVVHPVFIVPIQAAENMRRYFEGKEGF